MLSYLFRARQILRRTSSKEVEERKVPTCQEEGHASGVLACRGNRGRARSKACLCQHALYMYEALTFITKYRIPNAASFNGERIVGAFVIRAPQKTALCAACGITFVWRNTALARGPKILDLGTIRSKLREIINILSTEAIA